MATSAGLRAPTMENRTIPKAKYPQVDGVDPAHQQVAEGRHGEGQDGVEVPLCRQLPDAPAVGQEPEHEAGGRGEDGEQQQDPVGVPASQVAYPVEEDEPEAHPDQVVEDHGADLRPEGRPLGDCVPQRGPQGGGRGPHPPTTWSLLWPAANIPAAAAPVTISQTTWRPIRPRARCPEASRAGT